MEEKSSTEWHNTVEAILASGERASGQELTEPDFSEPIDDTAL